MGFIPSRPIADSEYLLERSAKEATLAAKACTAEAAAAHQAIARCYLARLFGEEEAAPVATGLGRVDAHRRTNRAPEPTELRFSDLRSVPDDDELTRLLDTLP